MTKMALLNNIDHPDLKVITRFGAAYGDSVNPVSYTHLTLPTTPYV